IVASLGCLSLDLVAQDPDAPAGIEHVKDAARVLQHFLRGRAGERAALRDDRLRRIRRQEPADLLHVARVANVEGAQAGGKPRDVHRVARRHYVRRIDLGDGVVRPEAPGLVAEGLVRRAGRRYRRWEERDQRWMRGITVVDEAGIRHRLLAIAPHRLAREVEELLVPEGHHRVDRLRQRVDERRNQLQLANQLRTARVADIEIHHRWRVAERQHLAVGAGKRGAVVARRDFARLLAAARARIRPASGLLWILRIAHIEDHQDEAAVARDGGGEIGVAPARIAIAMRALRAARPLGDKLRIPGVADVVERKRFFERLVCWRLLVQRRPAIRLAGGFRRGDRPAHAEEQQVAVLRELARGRALRTRHYLNQSRIFRIGDVDDLDAVAALVEHPSFADLLDPELDAAAPAVEVGIADRPQPARLPSGWNRIRERPGGEECECQEREPHAASFSSAPKSRDSRSHMRRSTTTAGWLGFASSRSGPIRVTAAAASPFHCSTGAETADSPGTTLESTKARRILRARSTARANAARLRSSRRASAAIASAVTASGRKATSTAPVAERVMGSTEPRPKFVTKGLRLRCQWTTVGPRLLHTVRSAV